MHSNAKIVSCRIEECHTLKAKMKMKKKNKNKSKTVWKMKIAEKIPISGTFFCMFDGSLCICRSNFTQSSFNTCVICMLFICRTWHKIYFLLSIFIFNLFFLFFILYSSFSTIISIFKQWVSFGQTKKRRRSNIFLYVPICLSYFLGSYLHI